MTILKLNLNFAPTIRSKFHHFCDSETNCLLRCAPALYINLLVIPARNRTLRVQRSKQTSDSARIRPHNFRIPVYIQMSPFSKFRPIISVFLHCF